MNGYEGQVLAYLYAVGSDYGITEHFGADIEDVLKGLAKKRLVRREHAQGNFFLTRAGRALFTKLEASA